MDLIHNNTFVQWVIESIVVLFFVGGIVVTAVGVGLLVRRDLTLRFFDKVNRWVSTRRVFREIEVPHDTRLAVQKHRKWLAVFFICGAVFALYRFGTTFDARAGELLFGSHTRGAMAGAWLMDSAQWMLIVGNMVALAIGILLGFFPDALTALEARGGRWYSERQLVKGADKMNLTLDNWVAASPRAAGWLITIAGVVLVSDFGVMLFGAR